MILLAGFLLIALILTFWPERTHAFDVLATLALCWGIPAFVGLFVMTLEALL